MEPLSYSSTLPDPIYRAPAVGYFFWNSHKLRSTIEDFMITIPQLLTVQLENQNSLIFQIKGEPCASLNMTPIGDRFNQGPYIDILRYSFKPLSNRMICISDTSGSTPAKKYMQSIQTNNTATMTTGSQTQTDMKGGFLNTFAPGFNYSTSKVFGTQSEKTEYDEITHLDGTKKVLSFNMSSCYEEDQVHKYNINDISTLRCSNLANRVYHGLIPLYGWFGGFLRFPDTVYTPPACALSSFGANWMLRYLPPGEIRGTILEFELTTEVRTVFASNDYDVIKQNDMGEYLNWIKTIHKISQLFEVKIDDDYKTSIQLFAINIKKICATGYENNVAEIRLVTDDYERSLSQEDVKEHCSLLV